jgi:hypothetical protein
LLACAFSSYIQALPAMVTLKVTCCDFFVGIACVHSQVMVELWHTFFRSSFFSLFSFQNIKALSQLVFVFNLVLIFYCYLFFFHWFFSLISSLFIWFYLIFISNFVPRSFDCCFFSFSKEFYLVPILFYCYFFFLYLFFILFFNFISQHFIDSKICCVIF